MDSAAIRKSYTRVDGKDLVVGNSDCCPSGDFGVDAQGKLVAQARRGLRDVATGLLRAVDKEAPIEAEPAVYVNAACCIFATDGYHEGIFIDKQRASHYTGIIVSSCNCQGAGAQKGYYITVKVHPNPTGRR